jgi:hypothetical protein
MTNFAFMDLFGHLLNVAKTRHDSVDLVQKESGFMRGNQSPAFTHQNRKPQALDQRVDQPANCGLGDAKLLTGKGNIACERHCTEGFQLSDLKHWSKFPDLFPKVSS